MALPEAFRGFIQRARGKDIDSIASSLLKSKPPKNPPHVEDINLLTSTMLEQAYPQEESIPNHHADTVRRPLAKLKHSVIELAHGAGSR